MKNNYTFYLKSLRCFLLSSLILFGVSAYSQSPGTLLWAFDTGWRGGDFWSSPSIGPDGTIYFGSENKKVYALNPNGTKKWEYLADNTLAQSPSIGLDGTVYIEGYALNPNGIKKWRFENYVSAMWSSHVGILVGSDGTLYSAKRNAGLSALRLDGSEKWNYKIDNDNIIRPSAIGRDGTIYGSSNFELFAIYPNGTKKWSYRDEGGFSRRLALGNDDTIYISVGTDDGDDIYAISSEGSKKWSFTPNDEILASPAVGPNGTIYAGCCDGYLYALNPNGKLKWEFRTRDCIESSAAIG